MKHILYILILFALINCSEEKHSSEIQKTTNDSTSNVEDNNEITKDSINYKKSKIDSLEEFKLVIKKAYETNPSNNWEVVTPVSNALVNPVASENRSKGPASVPILLACIKIVIL